MKKIMFIICTIMFLVACGGNGETNETYTTHPDTTPPPMPRLDLRIAIANDEFLSTFHNLHEVGDPEMFGERIVVWANIHLYDVSMIYLDFTGEYPVYTLKETHDAIDELRAGDGFVFHNYRGLGSLPWLGIRIVDYAGQARFFAMGADQSLGIEPNPSNPDFLEMVQDGQVRMTVTNGAGARWDIGYVAIDTDNFDPSTWFIENSHLWDMYAMTIWEISPLMGE